MPKNPTLLILAAGVGSRYGGLKQLDQIGPSGEAIIDYSIYDALEAGFGKVVFVIRRDLEEAFRRRFEPILKDRVPYEFAYQELDSLPEGYTVPEGREKPWGTAHAVWCARNLIDEPFAVINADDFYGKDAYRVLAKALNRKSVDHYMVAYYLKNTLSPHGSVSRGVCRSNSAGYLEDVTEYKKIHLEEDKVMFDKANHKEELDPKNLVSMNFWGFQPTFFGWLDQLLTAFLDKSGHEQKSEYFIPTVVNELIKSGKEGVKVLKSDAQWFGVTYREDKTAVEKNIRAMVDEGYYPHELWQ
ncbi:MAG: NTP transferase domain-containing protein [Bacteroidales bacterium]|nr:NTP transferase domain-containing protein [Bacteroidales bacterium]MCF8337655.1 NTP transferase domain-containing protein [Bacteroidales bacterium]